MATISTVAVDFIANVAKYTQGLTKVQKDTKKFATDASKQFKDTADAFNGMALTITKAATALASVAGIARFTAALQATTKEISMLADEAEKVGASAEQFSLLLQSIKLTGGTVQDLSKAYIELRKSINEANNGNKDTTKAFYDLGVSIKSITALDPDTRFLAIASALSKVSDSNERARIGTVLLGKSYNELSPLIDKGVASLVSFSKYSLREEEIQKIDALGKKYEQLGNTIDTKFKQVIISLEPILTALANSLLVIVDNIGKVSIAFLAVFGGPVFAALNKVGLKLIEIFGGSYLKEFASSSGNVFKAIFKNAEDIIKEFADKQMISNSPLAGIWLWFAGMAEKAFSTIRVAWAGLVAFMAASGFSVLGGLTAALGAFTVGVLAGLKLFQKANEIAADLAEKFGNDAYARELRIRAEGYAKTLELLVSPLTGDTSGVTPEIIAQRTAAAALQAEQAARKAAAGEREFADALQRAAAETKKFNEEMLKLAETTNQSVRTPVEKAQEEIDNLTDAFYFGYITADTYNKRLQQIKNSLDGIGAAQISLNSEMQAQNEIIYAQIAAQQELFGQGTMVGGPLPKGFSRIEVLPLEQAQKDELARLKSVSEQIKQDGMTAGEVYAKRVSDINAAAAATDEYGMELINVEQQTKALKIAQTDLFISTNPQIIQAFEFMSSFADQFARAIVEGKNFGDALSNVFKNILRDITALIIRTTILQGIMQLIGFISPTSGAAAAFGKITGLIPRASGGPVMAGNAYRVGEAGPETFIPSTNGYIIPNDMAPNESVNVTQNIYVQTGVAQTVRAEMSALLPRFKQEAMAGVLDAKQRGGSYSKLLTA